MASRPVSERGIRTAIVLLATPLVTVAVKTRRMRWPLAGQHWHDDCNVLMIVLPVYGRAIVTHAEVNG
jgi:hypothetical protein